MCCRLLRHLRSGYSLLLAAFMVLPLILGAQQKAETPYVLLVSFDGFRHDYVANFNPPHFKEFIARGSRAEAMIPSFPSKTFPNHYTLVTGLVPGRHGLVDNSFYDRNRKVKYGMRGSEVKDPYYYAGIPIWQLAREHGIKSASYFWVGSEMSDERRRPDYFFPYNEKVNPDARVTQVLEWLRLPEAERPHLITLYFSSPDHEGHEFGPHAEETKQAVLRADSLLGKLMTGLSNLALPVNVILVSDHGMSELTVSESTSIFLSELIDLKDSTVVWANGSTQAHLYIDDLVKRDAIYKSVKSKEKNFVVYRKEELPTHWKYRHDRIGDLLIEAKPQHYIREAPRSVFQTRAPLGKKFGTHGYDPEKVMDMRCIFYAQGPNIKNGLVVPPFQNVHVYPLLAKILGLPTPTIDGKAEVLEHLYREK